MPCKECGKYEQEDVEVCTCSEARRIAVLEEERDRYKKGLEDVKKHMGSFMDSNFILRMSPANAIVCKALHREQPNDGTEGD